MEREADVAIRLKECEGVIASGGTLDYAYAAESLWIQEVLHA